jgi:hypothetical protein
VAITTAIIHGTIHGITHRMDGGCMTRGITVVGTDRDITVAGAGDGTDHDIIVVGMAITTTIIRTIRLIREEIVTDGVQTDVILHIPEDMEIHPEDMLHRITATGIHRLAHVHLTEQEAEDRQGTTAHRIIQVAVVHHPA